jgi:parallel beta-helix repeat protein
MGNDGVVYLADAQGCAVEDCTFTNIGKSAVCIVGGSDNRVCGNDIDRGAEGGVLLIKTRRNTVSDNHIRDCGLVYKHVGGVVLEGSDTDDNVVSHNRIHDLPRYGISLKEAGRRNIIEYNSVANTNLETYDTGGIEVTQNDREFQSGSAIRYNLVHDTIGYSSIMGHGVFLAWGIYLDSFAGGYTVSHNIVYHSSYGGLFVQGGKGNKVFNNILIDNGQPQFHVANFQKHVTGLDFCRNIVGNRSSRVSLLWLYNEGEKVTRFERNLYFHADGGVVRFPGGLSLVSWQHAGRDNGSLIGDPQFVDPAQRNYALRPGSPALKLGFEPIDAGRIRLVRARCRCRAGPTLLDFAPWMAETAGLAAR